jgi:hypothetical protein
MTNPICPSCFSKHINYWLRDKNLSQKEVVEIVTELATLINEAEESPADTSCIVCGEKKVNLCTYCFTNKAKRVLEKSLRHHEVLNEFEEDFNTIIWRV